MPWSYGVSRLRQTPQVPTFAVPEPEPSILGRRIHQVIQSEKASSFADFTLISSDGVKFATSRMLLQITSPYFQSMLTSNFSEKNMSEVTLTIAAYYLKQVLEFIYVDDCILFRTASEMRNEQLLLKQDLTCKAVAELIELGYTADFLQMNRLMFRCERVLSTAIRQHPHFISVALQRLHQRKSTWGKRIYREAFDRLACFFKDALLDRFPGCDQKLGCLHFDDVVAEQVFSPLARNERSEVSMCLVFNALVIWGSRGTVLKEKRSSDPYAQRLHSYNLYTQDPYVWNPHKRDQYARDMHEQELILPYEVDMSKMIMSSERVTLSRKIAESFNLCNFNARFLHEIVEKSDLVDPNRFLEAYRTLCLQYEDEKKGKNDLNC